MTLYGYHVPKMASLIVWVILWEIVGRFGLLMLFPPFTEVIVAMGCGFRKFPDRDFSNSRTRVSVIPGQGLR